MRGVTRKSAPARERQARPVWRRVMARCLPVGAPVVLACCLMGWAVMSGAAKTQWNDLSEEFTALTADAGLSVEQVLVSGRNRTDRQTLIDALGIDVGEAMLALQIDVARERVAALPWIRDVTVERRLPNTLVVSLVERRPLALWQHDGEITVVDAQGEIIDGARPAEFAELMLVVGDDAPGHAAELLAVMARVPNLKERVAAAVRVGERRWNLRLDDGIDIQLPEDGLEQAWLALADMDRTEQLLARDVQAVDLRFPDRFVVRLTPDARARMEHEETEGEDT
ncbi:MAG: cell division protein FtsQ [Rhodospirillaceae bacterium]|nr:cell division protein FtsQ [Rhodospirillaceae bacterium]|tara:strand:+ start:1691 stop:2539 length:849 start_codon:yes stop_codon:yes gene_type:complete